MKPTSYRATRTTLRLRSLLGLLGLVVVVATAMPGVASAKNLFTLDAHPASGALAAVVVDSAGTGYFAWNRDGGSGPNVAMFCKVPRGGTCANPVVLPTPPAGFGGVTGVDAPYPVLSSGSTVYVVGPRFIAQDVVLWTSTDGGATFAVTATLQTPGQSEGSSPTDVLAAPGGGFDISSHNPGLDFTTVPASGAGPAPVTDLTPSGGLTNITDSTLGLAGGGVFGNPVEAFSMLNGAGPQTIDFTSTTGDPSNAANWTASSQVSQGITPSLAGGPSGLFLASEDTDAAGHYTQVHVRRYTPGSGFGAPIATLQTDTSYDNGGLIFQTSGGRVLVAWQGQPLPDGGVPIRLYDSSHGTSYATAVDVAEGSPHDAIILIRAAAADDGQGFVSFHEIGSGLLRVADLTAITPSVTAVAITPATFPAAPSGPSAIPARRFGTHVSYKLSAPGKVRFTVEQTRSGRRGKGGRCVAPKAAKRHARKCVLLVTLPGSFTLTGKADANRFRFTGRLAGRKLKPGRYRLVATPKPSARKATSSARRATSSAVRAHAACVGGGCASLKSTAFAITA